MLERVWRGASPLALLVGMRTGAAAVGDSVEISWRTGGGAAVWPSGPASGGAHWGGRIWGRRVHPGVHRGTVCHGRDVGAAWMPISGRVGGGAVVHMHHGVLRGRWKEFT